MWPQKCVRHVMDLLSRNGSWCHDAEKYLNSVIEMFSAIEMSSVCRRTSIPQLLSNVAFALLSHSFSETVVGVSRNGRAYS